MFAKLGDYLNQQNIQRPTRYAAPSGEEYVILPAKEYMLLTGIDLDALPFVEMFDTVPDRVQEERNEDAQLVSADMIVSAAVLAAIPLEEEISVDSLPL